MNVWLNEEHTRGYAVNWRLRGIIHTETTRYQELAVVDTYEWGKALVLDGIIQTTETDEFIYHEMISHVGMMAHPHPERVLIIGGGDGGVLREVLKYESVTSAELVEIDERVIENCRRYFPGIASGFADNRANIIVEDGLKYVKKAKTKYDVVIVDSSDPIGPAVGLFSDDFYRDTYGVLNEDGLVVAQAESPTFYQDTFIQVMRNMRSIFPVARAYLACIPTYVSGFWAFAVGSKKHRPEEVQPNRTPVKGLRYYSEGIHRAAFVLPPFIREMVDSGS